MGIIRFSAAERQGVLLPNIDFLRPERASLLGWFIIHSGGSAEALGPGVAEDITPPYLTRTRYTYMLTTPPELPTNSAAVDLRLRDASQTALGFDIRKEDIRDFGQPGKIVIPRDALGFPLLSIDPHTPTELLVHEFIFSTGNAPAARLVNSLKAI